MQAERVLSLRALHPTCRDSLETSLVEAPKPVNCCKHLQNLVLSCAGEPWLVLPICRGHSLTEISVDLSEACSACTSAPVGFKMAVPRPVLRCPPLPNHAGSPEFWLGQHIGAVRASSMQHASAEQQTMQFRCTIICWASKAEFVSVC